MLQAYNDSFPFGDCNVLMLFLLNASCIPLYRYFCMKTQNFVNLSCEIRLNKIAHQIEMKNEN
jgi:hypothetical protein